MLLGAKHAGQRLKHETLLPGLGAERLHHAAHPVAAGLGERAVGVDDFDIAEGAGSARVVDRHDLIEPRRRITAQRDCDGGRHPVGTAAHVGDDNLVAEPVHLEKRHAAHAGRSHRRLLRPYMAELTRNCQ